MAEGEATQSEADWDWPTKREEYELLNPIGEGSTSTVVKALCKRFNVEVAIKIIDLEETTADLDEILNEMMVMRQCRHPNLVTYYTCFQVSEAPRPQLWIVMKLLERGSILTVLRYKAPLSKAGVLDEPTIATILKGVLQGLDYLHTQGQIHRDVKAGNILLGNNGEVQLADFGVSAWVADDQFQSRDIQQNQNAKGRKQKLSLKVRSTFVGTPCWMAPEVMLQEKYNQRADIWSLGITAVEMATGSAPYAKHDPMKVLMMTIDGNPPSLETCSQELKKDFSAYKKSFRKFIALCLAKNPKDRPSAADLLKSEFIKKYAKDSTFLVRSLIEQLPLPSRMRVTYEESEKKKTKSGGRFVVSGWDFGGNAPSSDDDARKALEDVKLSPIKEKDTAPGVYNLRLRVRKGQEQQVDIAFSMTFPEETPETIAEELVGEEFIKVVDCGTVADVLTKLVRNPDQGTITFPWYGTKVVENDPRLDDPILAEGFGRLFIGEEAARAGQQVAVQDPAVASDPAAALVASTADGSPETAAVPAAVTPVVDVAAAAVAAPVAAAAAAAAPAAAVAAAAAVVAPVAVADGPAASVSSDKTSTSEDSKVASV